MDIAAFIEARLAEDEATANAPSPSGSRLNWRAGTDAPEAGDADQALRHYVLSDPDVAGVADTLGLERNTGRAVADHIARHDPARALREVAAKRAILYEHTPRTCGSRTSCSGCSYGNSLGASWPCLTVEKTAAVWSDHPDYRAGWPPENVAVS